MVALVSADALDLRPGDLFEAPWGRYVFRGRISKWDGGRVVLHDLNSCTTYVVPTPADLSAHYTRTGRLEERCLSNPTAPAPKPLSPPASEAAPDAHGAALSSAPTEPVADGDAPTAAPAGATGKRQRKRKAAPAPEPEPAPFVRPEWMVGEWWRSPPSQAVPPRRTLGALQPLTSYVSLPDVETLSWQQCMTGSAEQVDGRWAPHCHFIRSNQRPVFYCPTCRGETVRTESPGEAPSQDASTPPSAVEAPGDAVAMSGSPAAVVEVDKGSTDLAAAVEPAPVAPPAPPALPINLPRDDPRDEVASFTRPAAATPFSKALAAHLATPAPAAPVQRSLPAITPADLAAQRRAAEVAERKRLGFDREFWSERAGIREFWGEMPREAAEIAAYGDVADYLASMEFRR